MKQERNTTVRIQVTTRNGKSFNLEVYRLEAFAARLFIWEVHPEYSLQDQHGVFSFVPHHRQLVLYKQSGTLDPLEEMLWLDKYAYDGSYRYDDVNVGDSGTGHHHCLCHSEVGPIQWTVTEKIPPSHWDVARPLG